jgi:hypothetical protein
MFPSNIPRPRKLAARLAYDDGIDFESADEQTRRKYRRRAARLVEAGECEDMSENQDDAGE